MSFQEIPIEKPSNSLIDFDSLIEKTFVDVNRKITRPETILSIGEHVYKDTVYPTAVMTAGEFSCIVGPSKTKKSFLKSALCAAYIGGNSNNFFPNIKGHRDKDYVILDIDTEQSSYYAQKTFQRVQEMTGYKYENHRAFKLRALSIFERLKFIEYLIYDSEYSKDLKLVFIDGIADLMTDVNDLEQSNEIANYLLKWTEEKKIHICVIIHSAYGTKKATGHLGSTLIKKSESVIQLDPKGDDKRIIDVEHQYSRGFAFDSFSFSIKDNEALPYKLDDVTGDFEQPVKMTIPEAYNPNSRIEPASVNDAFDLDGLEVPF